MLQKLRKHMVLVVCGAALLILAPIIAINAARENAEKADAAKATAIAASASPDAKVSTAPKPAASAPATHTDPDPLPSASTPPQAPAEPQTTLGLTQVGAVVGCNMAGEREFTYGFKGHYLVDLRDAHMIEDKWVVSFGADITNEFGAKRSTLVMCRVGGTETAPEVETITAGD